uniref:Expansin-like EG45 domain-containing protein n=1 Tax=Populus alba TaxID=43335 RepID=A0A4U5PL13_POPAL|nr:hypothetical protein D5086_0000217160 [Populus alba]
MTMAATISLLLFVLHLCVAGTYGDDGGWQGGHATFYGGGDASGTMGVLVGMAICTVKGMVLTLQHLVLPIQQWLSCGSCYEMRCAVIPNGVPPWVHHRHRH